ncbi:MAG: CHRD domain-containing protein [Acidobacteria bacterium]|nr:CHRD domain-containing protein [Acidobacteriota bacterium]MCI0718680.1 CHRD domain-containing protein [Acidobacteriota bacterium]
MKRSMTAGLCVSFFALAMATQALAQSTQTFYVKAKMSPDNEVDAPAGLAGLNASGAARARITVNRDAGGTITSGIVIFDVTYQFPSGVTLSGFHIHTGAVGVNGGVVINSGLSSMPDADGAGALSFTTPTLTTATQLAALTGLATTPHLYYINLHTTDFPAGAIRGQCTSETYFYKATMLPSNEVPAITGLNASAPVLITLDVTRDSSGNITSGAVMFDTHYQFPGSVTFSGFHIHTGRAGENGPIIISSGISSIVDNTGTGRITKIVSLPTTQAMLDNLKAVITNPNGHYVNLHTTVNLGGAVRAQLADANQFSSIPFALDDGIFRSNLGIQNLTNMPGTVLVNLAAETGAGSAMTVSIPARGFVQLLNVNSLFGVGTRGVVHLDPDQHVEAFVSTIDNATNTPSIIPMNSKGTRLAIAAVTNLGGRYVSSLVVSNEGRAAATVDVLARDPGGAVAGQLTGVSIPAGGFFYRADILAALGIPSGYGPLEIRSTNGQPVSALSVVMNASNNRGAVMAGKEF